MSELVPVSLILFSKETVVPLKRFPGTDELILKGKKNMEERQETTLDTSPANHTMFLYTYWQIMTRINLYQSHRGEMTVYH